MKKIAILGTNGLPAKYGGFETLANYLSLHFSNENEVYVYCSKSKHKLKKCSGANLIYFPFSANGFQSIIYDFFTIIHALFFCDVLIILGFSGAFAFPLNKIFKKKIIFNLGGIEWKKVRGTKITSKMEIFLKKLMEYLCVKFSSFVIIDNEYFKDYIINKYKVLPILAEYGGDHAIFQKVENEDLFHYDFLNANYDLTISRAQSDMNIHLIIDAYKKTSKRKIIIISNWSISDYGKDLYSRYHNAYENIILLNAIYDLKLLNKIRSNCKLYIHSHSLCGTAPSLVEIMNLGIPVICFDVPTNRFTTENESKYFRTSEELVHIINKLDTVFLKEISHKMKLIADRRYYWKRITNIYRKLLY